MATRLVNVNELGGALEVADLGVVAEFGGEIEVEDADMAAALVATGLWARVSTKAAAAAKKEA